MIDINKSNIYNLNVVIEEKHTYQINWILIQRRYNLFYKNIIKPFKNLNNLSYKERIKISLLNKIWIKYCKTWNKYINKMEEKENVK